MKQTAIFQMLSDETRLRALALMAAEKELCVCELVHALEISQPRISRHMAVMRDAGVVLSRRHAQWVFHSISPDLPDWQARVVEAAVEGCKSAELIRQDRRRLMAMKGRPERCSAA
ncbi:MAG: transcriptional regulator [Desulfocapsa sp.]|nr:MAG: transcriptional regulator [Desulfocapsa sp.]